MIKNIYANRIKIIGQFLIFFKSNGKKSKSKSMHGDLCYILLFRKFFTYFMVLICLMVLLTLYEMNIQREKWNLLYDSTQNHKIIVAVFKKESSFKGYILRKRRFKIKVIYCIYYNKHLTCMRNLTFCCLLKTFTNT